MDRLLEHRKWILPALVVERIMKRERDTDELITEAPPTKKHKSD